MRKGEDLVFAAMAPRCQVLNQKVFLALWRLGDFLFFCG
jgi:hypothetical protein